MNQRVTRMGWFLLMTVSYALVALLNRPEEYEGRPDERRAA